MHLMNFSTIFPSDWTGWAPVHCVCARSRQRWKRNNAISFQSIAIHVDFLDRLFFFVCLLVFTSLFLSFIMQTVAIVFLHLIFCLCLLFWWKCLICLHICCMHRFFVLFFRQQNKCILLYAKKFASWNVNWIGQRQSSSGCKNNWNFFSTEKKKQKILKRTIDE